MNIVFFGNSKYSKLGFEIITKLYSVSLAVTVFDSPVSRFAKKLQIPVLETNKLDSQALTKISSLKPDFLVVEDYGLILPDKLLQLPKYAPLNIHHSLLPKYRGPSPAPTTILNGEKTSGVTVIKMTNKVDAGDILAQRRYTLKDDETTDSLLTILNTIGGELVSDIIKNYQSTKPIPQAESKATTTKFIKKEDGYFDINNPPSPEMFDRMIRAYYPWPNVWTRWSPSQTTSGEATDKAKIVKFYPGGLIQMEGKKVMPLKDFLNGYPDFPFPHY